MQSRFTRILTAALKLEIRIGANWVEHYATLSGGRESLR